MPRILVGLALLFATGATLLGAPARAQTQPQPGAIKITAPTNGATITGAFTLRVDISASPVKAAGEGDPQAFHYHALIDVDPATVVQPGQPLPTGQANIIHTADTALPIAALPPGQHTITVVLTRTDHVPLTPAVMDRVTFTVAGAAPATAPSTAPAASSAPPAGAPVAASPAAAPATSGAQPNQAITAPRTGHGGLVEADTRTPALALLLAAALTIVAGGLVMQARRRTR